MKRVVVVQARMTSSRLPGKVLMDLCGSPVLAQQIKRLKRCSRVDDIVIATTTNSSDDPIVDLAMAQGVGCFRGSESDVLSRFVGAAGMARADVVVRVTSDCPLIDPGVTDLVIGELVDHAPECDYASNVEERTYPRGLDVEAFFADVLTRMDRLGTSQQAREHVTTCARAERPDMFLKRHVRDIEDNSDLRWTVDYQTDLDVVRMIYERLDLASSDMAYRDMVKYVRANPELVLIDEKGMTWNPASPAH